MELLVRGAKTPGEVEQAVDLEVALASMSLKQRSALMLVAMGYTPQEVGALVGWKDPYGGLRRARRRLEKELAA